VNVTGPLVLDGGQLAVPAVVKLAGQVITGGWVSLTVTVKVQLAIGIVQVTVVVPFGKNEPDAGEHVAGGELLEQFPLTVGAGYVTTAPHWLGSFDLVMFAGHVMVGGCVLFTVTVNVHVAVLPEESATLQLTVVVPTGKKDPEAGEQPGVPTPGQLSLAVGGG